MSFSNKNISKLQKQEKIVEENPEEQRKTGTLAEEKPVEIKEAADIAKNSKTGEIKVQSGPQPISPPKRAPRLAEWERLPQWIRMGDGEGFHNKIT